MKLVDDVKDAWRWFSVQFPAINLAFLGTWSALPERFQASIPQGAILATAAVLVLLGLGGRLIKQDSPPVDAAPPK